MAIQPPTTPYRMDSPAYGDVIVTHGSPLFVLNSNFEVRTGGSAADAIKIAEIIAGTVSTNTSNIYPVVHPQQWTHLEIMLWHKQSSGNSGTITGAPVLKLFGAVPFTDMGQRDVNTALGVVFNEFYSDSSAVPPRQGKRYAWVPLVPNTATLGDTDIDPDTALVGVIANDATNKIEITDTIVVPLKGCVAVMCTVATAGTADGTGGVLGRFISP